MEEFTNALIHESSLYLQQHAHNPVNWVAWSNEAFEQAQRENKLVLVSVGYSSCHWCHVMEHECFEDLEVAALMNKFFVCIKVDREERPDIDQVYMTAVQLMTQRGGWPLNCFTLPDGSPIYGGTYFPKEQWMHVLKSLHHTNTNEPEKVLEYAEQLKQGVQKSDLIANKAVVSEFPPDKLWELVKRWKPRFDEVEGGPTHAPKFPLPNNFLFLLYQAQHTADESLMRYVHLTLHKMAFGGIYDQVGGGFSRYSVDMLWKVPHFEKMLYDNGQLLQLYAAAYRINPQPEYKRVLEGTLRWFEREMKAADGSLFAAQDADSEGEEGKYYVWKKEELDKLLGENFPWFWSLFNPENKGYWEHGNYVLIRNVTWEEACKSNPNLSSQKIQQALETLLHERKKRIAPVTDTKSLTAWNALTLTGLLEAYLALKDEAFYLQALRIGNWIRNFQLNDTGNLWHTRQDGKSFTSGFLDDYATVIEAFLLLYQCTSDQSWLDDAIRLNECVKMHFYDEQSGMYFFTPKNSDLIARKMEINDNVIPATNSIMAHNLLTLSQLTEQVALESDAKQQLFNVMDGMEQYGSGYSNWALLMLRFTRGIQVINVPKEKKNELELDLLSPFILVKYVDETEFSICANQVCSLPVKQWQEVKELLRS